MPPPPEEAVHPPLSRQPRQVKEATSAHKVKGTGGIPAGTQLGCSVPHSHSPVAPGAIGSRGFLLISPSPWLLTEKDGSGLNKVRLSFPELFICTRCISEGCCFSC